MIGPPLLDRVVTWARAEPNVIALIVTGSRAARHGRPDQYSDVDVELICDDPDVLIADDEWLHAFGDLLVYLRLSEGQRFPTRLAVYAEGEVDFTLCGRDRITGQADGLTDLYRRGYRVVFDEQGLTAVLPEADGRPVPGPPPTAEEYLRVVSNFWFEAFHMPGYLGREDLWALKFRDGTMKKALRHMLEWLALARDPGADVRQIGHGMREWVDEETWRDLHRVFGGFDAASSREALMATIEVFRQAAREVADAHGFDYPEHADRSITARLEVQ